MNSKLSVLIADDDPLTRTALSLQLDILGYPADYAKDGDEVVVTLAQNKYHLLIIDMHMGATDGLSTTLAIRENLPPEMQPYIAILTGGVTKVELDALNEAGIDEFIEKPVSIYNLQQLVERCSTNAALSTEPKIDVRNYPTGSHPGYIDFQILQELLNLDRQKEGHEAVNFLDLFFQTTPALMQKITDSSQNRQMVELKGCLHAMRSSCEIYGAKRLSQLCKELEKEIEQAVVENISGKVEAIESEYFQVSTILRTYQSSNMKNS